MSMVSDWTREAFDKYWSRQEELPWPATDEDLRDYARSDFAAGVAEGIRQAREAVAAVSKDWSVEDAAALLAAIDALGKEEG